MRKNVPLYYRIVFRLFTDEYINLLVRLIIVITILSAFIIKDLLGWSSLRSAITIGGVTSTVFLLLTSQRIKKWLHFKTLKGHWEYILTPEQGGNKSLEQLHDVKRIVVIDEDNGKLRIRGWLSDYHGAPKLFFYSNDVLFTDYGKKNGKLIYWYDSPHDAERELIFRGLANLEWSKMHPAQDLNRLSGWFFGRTTNYIGVVQFQRIPEKDAKKLLLPD